MKIITLLFVLIVHLNLKAGGNHEDAISFLGLEGIYNLEAIYNSDKGQRRSGLDHLIFMYSPKNLELSLALTNSNFGSPLIYFSDVDFKVNHTKNTLSLHAEGFRGSGIYGEINIEFDLTTSKFTGNLTDSIAQGYKRLLGKPLQTVNSLTQIGTMLKPYQNQLNGVYKDISNQDEIPNTLILRNYSGGNISAALSREDKIFEILFAKGIYTKPFGLLSFSKRVKKTGLFQKLLMFSKKVNGEKILSAFLFSTNGQFKTFTFKKQKEILFPITN